MIGSLSSEIAMAHRRRIGTMRNGGSLTFRTIGALKGITTNVIRPAEEAVFYRQAQAGIGKHLK
jgi:hypothetical protein